MFAQIEEDERLITFEVFSVFLNKTRITLKGVSNTETLDVHYNSPDDAREAYDKIISIFMNTEKVQSKVLTKDLIKEIF